MNQGAQGYCWKKPRVENLVTGSLSIVGLIHIKIRQHFVDF
jgi:hypothetical protein